MSIACPRCKGCGYTANDEDHTPWAKVEAAARSELKRESCNWCYTTGRIVREPLAGDIRIWAVRNPPASPTIQLVASLEEAKRILQRWIDADLQSIFVVANAFGCETFDGEEWSEWETDDTGDDICVVMDREKDASDAKAAARPE
jgi:hypothetical protein